MNKERILYYDIMNVMACIAVIALHHNGLVHSFTDTAAWKQSLWVECGAYWAVPIFLMLSGATLLDYRKKYSTKTFFFKRFTRVLIPWICWSIIILAIKVIRGAATIDSFQLKTFLDLFFNNKIESTYYYFGALIACYFAMPVFSLLTDNRKILWYVVALNFVFVSINTLVKNYGGITWNLDIPVVGSYFIFVCLGFLLDREIIPRKTRCFLYVLGVFMMIFRYICTCYYSAIERKMYTPIQGYVQFHSVIFAVAMFVFIKNIPWNDILSEKIKKILPVVSKYSFGIYLMHRQVMMLETKITGLTPERFLWRVVMIPVTYLICLMAVAFISKVPIVRKTIGC
ncbi:MAG: acyltransferase [Lachnospiraceae bacterium]|nr:acyltransferase [Lachnospiraceae bacterium]